MGKNMVTKIEIGHFKQTNNGIIVSKNRNLIIEAPDIAGRYKIEAGEVGISFSEHSERGYKYVDLEIGQAKELQTRECRGKRKVNVSNEGRGQVQISKGRILYITTDAFKRR